MTQRENADRRGKLRRLKLWMGASFLAPLAAGPLILLAQAWIG
ncbi:hypothetical protein [Rubrimonas cliftonensis]|uniref:Uncharacterized protein n=1 Tax=Rubrimonas cliftonensis TaxID=89524 RepID=A0A1H4GAP3_9RHOB|nr:hypothetical protein [Rubrimonas cliftonensis]SEB06706.1 hypothetical protein SAMN05444370_1479 [Rubrimonas cliftonensis]